MNNRIQPGDPNWNTRGHTLNWAVEYPDRYYGIHITLFFPPWTIIRVNEIGKNVFELQVNGTNRSDKPTLEKMYDTRTEAMNHAYDYIHADTVSGE